MLGCCANAPLIHITLQLLRGRETSIEMAKGMRLNILASTQQRLEQIGKIPGRVTLHRTIWISREPGLMSPEIGSPGIWLLCSRPGKGWVTHKLLMLSIPKQKVIAV